MGCDSFSYLVLYLIFLKNIYEVCSQNNTMICWNISNISYKVLKKNGKGDMLLGIRKALLLPKVNEGNTQESNF